MSASIGTQGSGHIGGDGQGSCYGGTDGAQAQAWARAWARARARNLGAGWGTLVLLCVRGEGLVALHAQGGSLVMLRVYLRVFVLMHVCVPGHVDSESLVAMAWCVGVHTKGCLCACHYCFVCASVYATWGNSQQAKAQHFASRLPLLLALLCECRLCACGVWVFARGTVCTCRVWVSARGSVCACRVWVFAHGPDCSHARPRMTAYCMVPA